MRFCCLFFFVIINGCSVTAQHLEGYWEGKMYRKDKSEDTVLVQMNIKLNNKNNYTGTALCRFANGDHAETILQIIENKNTGKVKITELDIISTSLSTENILFLDKYFLFEKTPGQLMGVVKCYSYVKKANYPSLPCHPDMYIELTKAIN